MKKMSEFQKMSYKIKNMNVNKEFCDAIIMSFQQLYCNLYLLLKK